MAYGMSWHVRTVLGCGGVSFRSLIFKIEIPGFLCKGSGGCGSWSCVSLGAVTRPPAFPSNTKELGGKETTKSTSFLGVSCKYPLLFSRHLAMSFEVEPPDDSCHAEAENVRGSKLNSGRSGVAL